MNARERNSTAEYKDTKIRLLQNDNTSFCSSLTFYTSLFKV